MNLTIRIRTTADDFGLIPPSSSQIAASNLFFHFYLSLLVLIPCMTICPLNLCRSVAVQAMLQIGLKPVGLSSGGFRGQFLRLCFKIIIFSAICTNYLGRIQSWRALNVMRCFWTFRKCSKKLVVDYLAL